MTNYRQKTKGKRAGASLALKPSGPKVVHAPMGNDRFRELMAALSASFAQSDQGAELRAQMNERQRQHEVWMTKRNEVIKDIVSTMERYQIWPEDLI